MRLLPLLAALAALAACAAPPGPSVAPVADAGFYLPESETTRRTPADTVASGPGVVSAGDPRAAAAGVRMLEAGGNAADATIAVLLALTVAEPQSSGIGGGGFLLWHDAGSGEISSIDARETAPAAATPRRFLQENGKPVAFLDAVAGGQSVGVPGIVALAAELHRRHGSLPWARLFEPAIALARDGVAITERGRQMALARRELLAASPAAAQVFLDPHGEPWPVGHVLKQPELQKTLETLARDGPEAFYRGAVGTAITDAVANAFVRPAELTAADLAAYRAVSRPPLCRPYRTWRVCTMGPPSSGGIAVLQILGQLERFDLKQPDNLLTWHLIAESQRLAYADREAWTGDSDFVPVPVAGLLADSYIAGRSALIRIDRAMPEARAGTPPGTAPRAAAKLGDIPATSHLVVADRAGNVASVTSTIEGIFGSGLMAGGFMLNNELTDFDFLPVRPDGARAWNRIEPGKRPRSSMAPVILYDPEGRAAAAYGAAGGATIIAQVAKMVIATIDWGLPVEEAIAAPQLVADRRGVRLEKDSRLETMAAGFRALGHRAVEVTDLPLKGNGLARTDAGWRAAGDMRSDGQGAAMGKGTTH